MDLGYQPKIPHEIKYFVRAQHEIFGAVWNFKEHEHEKAHPLSPPPTPEIALLICTTELTSTAQATPPHILRSTAHAPSIVSQSAVASKGATGRSGALKHCRIQPSTIGSDGLRLLRPSRCQSLTFLRVTTFLRCVFFDYLAFPCAGIDGEGYNTTIGK